MTELEKRSLIEVLRSQYRRSGKVGKGKILDEVLERLSVGRRQAKRLLSAHEVGRPRKPVKRGRPSRYQDPEFIGALKQFWKRTRYMCSRHLKAAIPEWLVHIEAERGRYPEHVRERLLSVSAATIDRILCPYKALKGKPLTRSGGFRDQIPIQQNIWNEQRPGFLEADTVAHCGGAISGEYVHSLTMVDIATTWTETRAVFGKGSTPIVHAIEDIENSLPFAILGYDADNGTEVLNQHILNYFQKERIALGNPAVQVTRSREYRKNDNAHVEQKNNSVARRWLGYERLDFREITVLVNFYYKWIVSPLMNHFFPSFKLADKVLVKSRTRRIYLDPVTPYARVMASPHVESERKQKLEQAHKTLNPLVLLDYEYQIRKRIDLALKALKTGDSADRLLLVPPSVAVYCSARS